MDVLAAAFWGAYFGAGALMFLASLAAFVRVRQRVALTAGLSSLLSSLFVAAYLGWLPMADADAEARLLAHIAVICALALGLMLLAMLGLPRRPDRRRRLRTLSLCLAATALAAGWWLEALEALALGSMVAFGVGALALAICVRSALRGDRLAWTTVSAVSFMLIAVSGLSWIALHRAQVHWQLHAVSAVAGVSYLAALASVLWVRYSYLIELREVIAHGPNYDPVTRMRSHAETCELVGASFSRHADQTRPVGVIVVSIGNFYALEKLHGRGAVNHALFVCAGRLRRCVPLSVEMGRLSDDGFLLLMRNATDPQALVQVARDVAARLLRPVVLSTSLDPLHVRATRTQWVADVGVGVLQASPLVRPAGAVTMARAMSRTAWSYVSRVAWFDQAAEQIAELTAAHSV